MDRLSEATQSDSLASGAWPVTFQHIGSIQQPNADRSESVDAAREGRMLSLSGIQERQGDNRKVLADRLDEEAKSEGVADPRRPLVDRVEGGRRDHDGVRSRQHPGPSISSTCHPTLSGRAVRGPAVAR